MALDPADPLEGEMAGEEDREPISALEFDGNDVDPDENDSSGEADHDAQDIAAAGYGAVHSETAGIEGRSSSSPPIPEKLGVVSMAVLVFYSVSGGPFGIETTVRAGGNFYAILGFLVMPLMWSLQEALMTAELGTALPEASGGVVWVEEAFGPLAGWMAGFLSWVGGATGRQHSTAQHCRRETSPERSLSVDGLIVRLRCDAMLVGIHSIDTINPVEYVRTHVNFAFSLVHVCSRVRPCSDAMRRQCDLSGSVPGLPVADRWEQG
jgi:hypothetical protein